VIGLPSSLGSFESLIQRYERAVDKRQLWRSLMQDCYRYAIPDRELFDFAIQGQRKGAELYDSTAVEGVKEFGSRIEHSICPAGRQWTKMVPGPGLPKEMREDDELQLYLEEQTDIFFGYIHHSNFALKAPESFQDLAVGTGAITLELNEQRNGFVFDAIPPAHLAIEEGPTGLIETAFMDRKMPPANLKRIYPGCVLPQKWAKLNTEKAGESVEFQVGCVYEPRRAEYWLVVFSKAEKALIYVRNYGQSSPCIVFRWNTVPGETWGRGPVMGCLPDIKTVNKVVETILRGGQLNLAPVFTAVTDGVLNPYTAQILPNAIIPVMSNDTSNPSIRQLTTDVRPDMAQLILEDLRGNIRRALFSDPRRREGPIESATEVLIEDREFLQRIGSSSGRIQSEFVEKVINRGVYLLKSIGKMADFRVDGREVTLKHLSPLARAQDQQELLSLRTGVELLMPFGPEALHMAVKTEDIGEWIMRTAGVPSDRLRSDAERKKMVKRVTEAAAQAATAQQQGVAPAQAA
jgi:hypothetical protein